MHRPPFGPMRNFRDTLTPSGLVFLAYTSKPPRRGAVERCQQRPMRLAFKVFLTISTVRRTLPLYKERKILSVCFMPCTITYSIIIGQDLLLGIFRNSYFKIIPTPIGGPWAGINTMGGYCFGKFTINTCPYTRPYLPLWAGIVP